MGKRTDMKITVLLALSFGLMAAAAAALLLALYYRRVCFGMLGGFSEEIIRKYPDARQDILEMWKSGTFRLWPGNGNIPGAENILSAFGYRPSDLGPVSPMAFGLVAPGFLAGGMVLLFAVRYRHRKLSARIRALTEYLERINAGGQGVLLDSCEDGFSRLQDEIYKTVTELCQTRDAALTARNSFAENLSNIAHQLKTPITSISLSVQMAKEHSGGFPAREIEKQIRRLACLEEALLLLSRIDAGTLVLDRKPSDVFTLLTLAADNLYELSAQKGIVPDIPEMGGIDIRIDMDWTMEAVMNLMKNCIEAAEAGTAVHCSYEGNPLYVQIRIWDEGPGFANEDLPHLFERFYRGKRAKASGIGIGLSLSRAIIEMQSGIIRAFNLPAGGACFEIRFYSH